jgi:endonuclease G
MPISQTAMDESFLMSNISPQVGKGFNRGYWSRFEGFIRHLAHQFDGLYVVTGPLFLAKVSNLNILDTSTINVHYGQQRKKTGEYSVTYPVIGTPPDAISVPTHFFKVH